MKCKAPVIPTRVCMSGEWRRCGEGGKWGWSHNELVWLVWSCKAAAGLHHHLLLTPSLPRQGAGKRKDQDQCKALRRKERSCKHLYLGLHRSFLLPDSASQMFSEGGSILSPDDSGALGPWWWLGFLTNNAIACLSSSHCHWP